jgi:hypothetical protein
VNISGASAAANASGANTNSSSMKLMDTLQSVQDLMADLMNTSDEGAFHAGSSKTDIGKPQADIQGGQTAAETGKPSFIAHAEDTAAALAASQNDEVDQLKKQKRKEKAFKEKLNLLMKMVDDMDLSELDPEDKDIIEQFIKNAQTINTLQGELKFLEDKEIYYKSIIEKKKQQESR